MALSSVNKRKLLQTLVKAQFCYVGKACSSAVNSVLTSVPTHECNVWKKGARQSTVVGNRAKRRISKQVKRN